MSRALTSAMRPFGFGGIGLVLCSQRNCHVNYAFVPSICWHQKLRDSNRRQYWPCCLVSMLIPFRHGSAMKPASFEYIRASSLEDVCQHLASQDASLDVVLLAGGQTLVPLMAMRLAQPTHLIDINYVAELTGIREHRDHVEIGAVTRQRAVEHDPTVKRHLPLLAKALPHVGHHQTRNRGTIGGSLAHADPAADWIACLTALGAEILVHGPAGRRKLGLPAFIRGALETALEAGEILEAVRIPRLGAGARWGYYKVNRKTGEFAHAIGAVLHDPERDVCRAVAGATESRAIVIEDAGALIENADRAALLDRLREGGLGADAYSLQIHAVALERAIRALS